MENGNTQTLAEKIASLLQREPPNADFYSMQSSLEKINHRLDSIESQISFQNTNSQSAIHNSQPFHSSQEKFVSLEELADEIINNSPNEKACPYEPTGKPCDHCAMCNSRGF
jgi:hypothetical protein